jgi:quinol-cytochrome oxidoreductase complex cytochrome b subunit
MTLGFVVMMLGAFVIPALLLWAGHRVRRRSPRWIAVFWGAVIGHMVALVVGTVAAMTPAAEWAPTDFWRGALGYWSFAVFPLIGALVGLARASRRA